MKKYAIQCSCKDLANNYIDHSLDHPLILVARNLVLPAVWAKTILPLAYEVRREVMFSG